MRGAEVPVGLHVPVVRVAFQQSNQGYPLDDIVAWGHADLPAEEPCIQIQVKRTVKATAANPEFIKVMAQAVTACEGESDRLREQRMFFGLAARPSRGDHLNELAELTELARAHEDPGSFESQFCEGVTEKTLRNRLTEVTKAVATAAGASDGQTASPLTHQILMALHVWRAEEGPDSQTWRTELEGLADLSAKAGVTPMALMNQLRSLAQQFGPRAGDINAEHVRKELIRYGIYLSPVTIGVKRSATNSTTINATGNSTVFNNTGGVQNFGPIHIGNRRSAREEENGAS